MNPNEFVAELPEWTQHAVRAGLLQKLAGTVHAVNVQKYETLKARARLSSVLTEIAKQKSRQNIAPIWGSW